MRIKKRVNAINDEPVKVPDMPKFPDIVAKPKKPVEDAGFFQGVERIPGSAARRFGPLAEACGDMPTDIPLSVADRFKLLRTVYDDSTPTEQRYRNRTRNRQTAITTMCVICSSGSRKLVTECDNVVCPLWAFRFGRNPYRGRK